MAYTNQQFPYLYETHAHTSQSSACSVISGAVLAGTCKKAGYTGLIVTDHFWGGNCAVDRTLPWRDWVHCFCAGYEDAAAEGKRIGLDVFFGWEQGYHGTEFLIYGLDKQWLLDHPEIVTASIAEQFELIHASGGMVIHAHPFREEPYIPKIRLFPDLVDGVEVCNAAHSSLFSCAHRNPLFNERAAIYATEHSLPATAGSDIHSTLLLFGGMAFVQRLSNIQDFINSVRTHASYLLLDGTTPKFFNM